MGLSIRAYSRQRGVSHVAVLRGVKQGRVIFWKLKSQFATEPRSCELDRGQPVLCPERSALLDTTLSFIGGWEWTTPSTTDNAGCRAAGLATFHTNTQANPSWQSMATSSLIVGAVGHSAAVADETAGDYWSRHTNPSLSPHSSSYGRRSKRCKRLSIDFCRPVSDFLPQRTSFRHLKLLAAIFAKRYLICTIGTNGSPSQGGLRNRCQ